MCIFVEQMNETYWRSHWRKKRKRVWRQLVKLLQSNKDWNLWSLLTDRKSFDEVERNTFSSNIKLKLFSLIPAKLWVSGRNCALSDSYMSWCFDRYSDFYIYIYLFLWPESLTDLRCLVNELPQNEPSPKCYKHQNCGKENDWNNVWLTGFRFKCSFLELRTQNKIQSLEL